MDKSILRKYEFSEPDDYTGTDLIRVGGVIFFIDETVEAEYCFYDRKGKRLENPKVGDCPAYYTVNGRQEKPKYWILYPELFEERTWNYRDTEKHCYLWEPLGTGTALGTGKVNTDKILSLDGGRYIRDYNIWGVAAKLREKCSGGCNDWFIPSRDELDELRKAAGVLDLDWFRFEWLWSSSEYSANGAWFWSYDHQSWSNSNKFSPYSVCAVRAF